MAAFANQGSEVNPGPAPEPGVTPNPTEPAKVVDIRIDTSAERKPISPYIYGSNQELDATVTAKSSAETELQDTTGKTTSQMQEVTGCITVIHTFWRTAEYLRESGVHLLL